MSLLSLCYFFSLKKKYFGKYAQCEIYYLKISNVQNNISRHISGIFFNLKTKKIQQYATTCMKLEDIMLSEINQSQKDK